ncbi:hypothetical protein M378DRAFT_921437 [Amanita muscaria Koide BX008]|uniref:Uncharacterized protein n=1 Tax=Amanita muscaria (strain Koide BX008) TaxID=946122 RepID=A0A0C2T1U4_AMAMK|nr:hypothetical protein M378DRAFT_921437 [Amanita muscaria Koide BX008]
MSRILGVVADTEDARSGDARTKVSVCRCCEARRGCLELFSFNDLTSTQRRLYEGYISFDSYNYSTIEDSTKPDVGVLLFSIVGMSKLHAVVVTFEGSSGYNINSWWWNLRVCRFGYNES